MSKEVAAPKKRTKTSKPKIDVTVIEGLGKMQPVSLTADAPKLKSALTPSVLLKKGGQQEEKPCKVCDTQIKRDNGAENDTMLKRTTPRIRSQYIPI